MHRFILLLFTIGTALTATSIFAQEDQVRNIHFDTVRTGDVQATPVGVDEMKYIGTDYISADDSAYMRYITRIVQRDIDFYADFELVLVDSFYVKMYEIDEVSLLGWMRLGATYLVRLEAEFPGKNIRVRWRLFDCARGQRFARGKLDRNRTYWRELGHDIANEIVHTLTGEPGIFRSRIAYVRKIGKAKEIFVADYDGANEQQLTQTGSINISPMFAPNKDEVYFTSFMRGEPHLYKVDIFSKDITPVASYPGIVAAATLSPDGNKIACTLSKDGNSEIYVLNLKGKVIKRLTRHKAIDSSPTWSPDGRMMAFTSDRSGTPQIYMMDSDGLNVRRLTYQGGYNDSPIWSDRGDRITFVTRTKRGRFDLASIDTSGADYRILTEVGMNENPHFSPDGKHIIFSSTRLGPRDIFTMDLTGRKQRRLTRSGSCSNPTWGRRP